MGSWPGVFSSNISLLTRLVRWLVGLKGSMATFGKQRKSCSSFPLIKNKRIIHLTLFLHVNKKLVLHFNSNGDQEQLSFCFQKVAIEGQGQLKDKGKRAVVFGLSTTCAILNLMDHFWLSIIKGPVPCYLLNRRRHSGLEF